MKFTYTIKRRHEGTTVLTVHVTSEMSRGDESYLGKLHMLPVEWDYLKNALSKDKVCEHVFEDGEE